MTQGSRNFRRIVHSRAGGDFAIQDSLKAVISIQVFGLMGNMKLRVVVAESARF